MDTLLQTDFYKIGHPFQYPKGTTRVYANGTCRKSRIPGIDKVVFFGLQYFIKKYLIKGFNDNFFSKPIEPIIASYRRRVVNSLGSDLPTYDHIRDLHKLGYLPIKIKALPEGSVVPIRVPFFTIVNTEDRFYWLTNWMESLLSAEIWQAFTSATIAFEYRKKLNRFAEVSGMPREFVQWQGHDFSFRGMSSLESAVLSGMGHLLSFTGTDTIPAIDALEEYYNADSDKELIGGSVPATEHSVMCAGGKDGELETFNRLISEVYPSGIVSIVSDTWDLWHVLTDTMVELKNKIMERDGKVVIRPDSGNPVDIICGTHKFVDNNYHLYDTSEKKGVVQLLWEAFGGTINEKGFKVLDSHVGAIYGDSITLDVAQQIGDRLIAKGFAMQCVLGIGSYTYQMNTRDTFGFAMKATHVTIKGEEIGIFKDPITDDGTKKSAIGLLRVCKVVGGKTDGDFILYDQCSEEEEEFGSCLTTVFENGKLVKDWKLSEIRSNLNVAEK